MSRNIAEHGVRRKDMLGAMLRVVQRLEQSHPTLDETFALINEMGMPGAKPRARHTWKKDEKKNIDKAW